MALSKTEKALDDAWSLLVKLLAGNKCEIKYCPKGHLNSHHIYTRKNRSVRWDVLNGVCLCAGHHMLYTEFSAHGTPVTFNAWLMKSRGVEKMDLLEAKAHTISKLHPFEKELLLKELLKEIKELK